MSTWKCTWEHQVSQKLEPALVHKAGDKIQREHSSSMMKNSLPEMTTTPALIHGCWAPMTQWKPKQGFFRWSEALGALCFHKPSDQLNSLCSV